MYSIETNELTHSFSENEKVVNAINLQVPSGSIYGFLGPNGAGKTTTLRLILGLIKKQKGTISILGKTFEEDRLGILNAIGSMIESPSLYGHLTAKENLRILQKIYQCPKGRIDEVLEIVDLTNTGKKKAGKFSLGMKQRLSIAMALLHNPQLLILDEPTNGLDPNGIIEIRELLIKLNREQNVTIVISSHLLSEIEKMVTHIGIINKGVLLFQGSLEELHQKQSLTSSIKFGTNDPEKTKEILKKHELIAVVENNFVVLPIIDNHLISILNKELVDAGIEVYRIEVVKNDLESIFMDLVK